MDVITLPTPQREVQAAAAAHRPAATVMEAISDDRQAASTGGERAPAGTRPGDSALSQIVRLAVQLTGADAGLIGVLSGATCPAECWASYGLVAAEQAAALNTGQHFDAATGVAIVSSPGGLAPALSSYRSGAVAPAMAGAEGRPMLLVLAKSPRHTFESSATVWLPDLLQLAIADRAHTTRYTALLQENARAVRADRMQRIVSEAATCADALSGVLGELCREHEAAVGRIWQLTDRDGLLREVSRFNAEGLSPHSYYQLPADDPMTADNNMTAEAIRQNEPTAVIYDEIDRPERYRLLPGAIASGLQCQVSFPIWVQDQRFGISLAFSTPRTDLDAVVFDISALTGIIRPALFRKVAEERIRHVARHDDLTQLANRLVFQERLSDCVGAASRGEHGLALLYLDLDGFKAVNDSSGHETGDKLLAAVAERLQESVREGDTVARVGGDEFAVVQPLSNQPTAATSLADRLVETIALPFDIDGQHHQIGLSVGIAIYPDDGETPEVLLRNADTALYRAKAAGRSTYRLFDPSMDLRHREQMTIEQDLGQAIDRAAFTLLFQPICSTATLDIRGFEALLRWDHPVRGTIQPDRFVPLAEASGLILPLGRWALEAACEQAVAWEQPLRLSVNLSPLQFRQPDLPQQVSDILARTGLPASRLDLEVTEGLLLDDSGLVLRTMRAMKEQGVGITLDDFGTAYASLSYLRRFPFDRIKIDKSFVQALGQDDGTLAIVEAILSLSARLNLVVVAEGVETARELALLRRLNCALVQGFLTGMPMDRDKIRGLMRLKASGHPITT